MIPSLAMIGQESETTLDSEKNLFIKLIQENVEKQENRTLMSCQSTASPINLPKLTTQNSDRELPLPFQVHESGLFIHNLLTQCEIQESVKQDEIFKKNVSAAKKRQNCARCCYTENRRLGVRSRRRFCMDDILGAGLERDIIGYSCDVGIKSLLRSIAAFYYRRL